MDKFLVEGGHPIVAALPISGSKNTALALMAATLLADGKTTISNIPVLRDIRTFSQVIAYTGAEVDFDEDAHALTIDASKTTRFETPYELVKKMRASFYMLGALLGRFGKARVSLPGGCAWGPRPVDLHLKGLEALGAKISLDRGYVDAHIPGGRLQGGVFRFEPSSVGATINLMLAASKAKGYSRLERAAREPDVVVFGEMLQTMGARIEGLGSDTIEIEGVDQLDAIAFDNCPDRIELGTFMIAAALAGRPGNPIQLTGVNADHLGAAFLEAFEATGASVKLSGDLLEVTAPKVIQPVNVATGIYPGFPTDLQAQWTVLMTQADGNSKIEDSVYRDRFKHIPELMRMGANAIVVGNEVVIQGNSRLQGAQVMSTDLRASVSLVLAGMVAEGQTDVLRVYHLDRGYENLEGKLTDAGASVKRVRYDEWSIPDSAE